MVEGDLDGIIPGANAQADTQGNLLRSVDIPYSLVQVQPT